MSSAETGGLLGKVEQLKQTTSGYASGPPAASPRRPPPPPPRSSSAIRTDGHSADEIKAAQDNKRAELRARAKSPARRPPPRKPPPAAPAAIEDLHPLTIEMALRAAENKKKKKAAAAFGGGAASSADVQIKIPADGGGGRDRMSRQNSGNWRKALDQQKVKTMVMNLASSKTVHRNNRIGKDLAPAGGWAGSEPASIQAKIGACLQTGIASQSKVAGGLDFTSQADFVLPKAADPGWLNGRELPSYEFISHRSGVFADIRSMFDINNMAYVSALGLIDWSKQTDTGVKQAMAPDLRLVGTADAAGKSLAWFFFSSNQQYVLKSTTLVEKELLLKILPKYHARIQAAQDKARATGLPTHTHTLLPQLFGLYSVKMDVGGKPMESYWIVMKNILVRHRPTALPFFLLQCHPCLGRGA